MAQQNYNYEPETKPNDNSKPNNVGEQNNNVHNFGKERSLDSKSKSVKYTNMPHEL